MGLADEHPDIGTPQRGRPAHRRGVFGDLSAYLLKRGCVFKSRDRRQFLVGAIFQKKLFGASFGSCR